MPHALPLTLAELVQTASLSTALEQCAAVLRNQPDAQAQHLLRLELLCLKGDWGRAGTQLETCARLDASRIPHLAVSQALIRCEKEREAVFAGTAVPHLFPTDQAPTAWPVLLLQALGEQALGHIPQADALRTQALDLAPEYPGHAKGGDTPVSFAWITDSDTRLGPILEAYVQDRYVWLPIDCLRHIELDPPRSVRDVIWQPARLQVGATLLHAFLPARYPTSGQADDVLALGRETRWTDVGRTGVFGLGHKVWCTDAGDLPMRQVSALVFDSAPPHTVLPNAEPDLTAPPPPHPDDRS